MVLLLLERHAVEVHILVFWSHENVANGSLVSVTLWSRRVIVMAVSMVYSSREFQLPEDDAAGFSKTRASGVYQSYFWDIHTTCHTWLVLVVIAWAWVSHVLPEWNSLFVNNRHCARGNQSCFCLLVMSSSRVRHSCSWLSLHTSVIQALFGKNLWNLLQRDKEYTVLLSWLSQTLTSWFLFSPWTLFTRQLIFWS